MKHIKHVATLFSGGKFEEAADDIAENIEWHIYEEKMQLNGKQEVLNFCKEVTKYFKSMTTNFENFGVVEGDAKVAIYGRAEFIRESERASVVYSCDIYEFNAEGKIAKIYSYCNSEKKEA